MWYTTTEPLLYTCVIYYYWARVVCMCNILLLSPCCTHVWYTTTEPPLYTCVIYYNWAPVVCMCDILLLSPCCTHVWYTTTEVLLYACVIYYYYWAPVIHTCDILRLISHCMHVWYTTTEPLLYTCVIYCEWSDVVCMCDTLLLSPCCTYIMTYNILCLAIGCFKRKHHILSSIGDYACEHYLHGDYYSEHYFYMTLCDITINNDIARDVHCDVTMGIMLLCVHVMTS